MSNISHPNRHAVPTSLWHTCQITGQSINDITKRYGGSGIYRGKAFSDYLMAEHNLSLNEYFITICKLVPPLCFCGACNQPCVINIPHSSKIYWSKSACGRCPNHDIWIKQMSKARRGKKNPMYGRTPWNKGKTKYNNEIINRISKLRLNRKASDDTKEKQSRKAKKRWAKWRRYRLGLPPGMTGRTHSKQSNHQNRLNTLRRLECGNFPQTKTKPHIMMSEILQKLHIDYIEEKKLSLWSFDFFLPQYNVYLEVDGDYFHSNPKRYPDGPISKTQKRNKLRDIKKDQYCQQNNIKLIRFWESDIINRTKSTTCKLQRFLK